MSWTTGGDRGWSGLGADSGGLPVSRPLPTPVMAAWYDPTPLGGIGNVIDAAVLEYGASTARVRHAEGSFEARLVHPEVFGVAIVDSFFPIPPLCSLVLTVYDDDQETVLWSVGTDIGHPRPFLVEPDNYGSQELDFAQGGATLGTVRVTVIDPAQVAGDQDSGYVTERLARLGIASLGGRRCKLERFISEEIGYQVIIDGPAGQPELDASYAAYSWDIRDVREIERKILAFTYAGREATGLRSLVPDELMDGYGYDADLNTYLMRPALPLRGICTRVVGYPNPSVVTVLMDSATFPEQARRLLISQESYEAIINSIGRIESIVFPNNDFIFRWRAANTADPWNEVPGAALGVTIDTDASTITSDTRLLNFMVIEDRRLNPFQPEYDPTAPDLPGNGVTIECFLIGALPTSELHPVVLDSAVVPGVQGPLNPTAALNYGHFHLVTSIGGISAGTIDLLGSPVNAEDIRRQTVPVFNRLGNLSTTPDIFIPTSGLFSWRLYGSSDPFTEITLQPALPGQPSALIYIELPFRDTYRVFTMVQLAANDADVPADDEVIEFTIQYIGVQEQSPITVGETAGQVAKNAYDGLYSPRGPNGELIPTGIRYDVDALLAMTDPVKMILSNPVDDLRDWLEKTIYAPTGWVPALDALGRVSPMSQIPPQDTTSLPRVTAANTEPAPSWNAGATIINVVRFTYSRHYNAGPPDPPPTSPAPPTGEERQGVIKAQAVDLEFRDDASVARHGEQILEIDGTAFAALGVVADSGTESLLKPNPFWRKYRLIHFPTAGGGFGAALVPLPPPVTVTPVVRPAVFVEPLHGEIADEIGYRLAQLRQLHVQNRYSLGAPSMTLNVMRAAMVGLRAGGWVIVDLPWMPDYLTGRRGLVTLAQVTALGDLDCAWRELTLEQVIPIEGS